MEGELDEKVPNFFVFGWLRWLLCGGVCVRLCVRGGRVWRAYMLSRHVGG